ncbi:kinase-like protein [Sodiomyces alkalinus F11]|uniref:Kinase-like protein n=1 Tax=Sodiomyces alkalinus (strain CBS 110278 / VKM F-3762 / F11) TaxID=1314773 RepID=A0A3N2Q3A1_SODAK|nr:kinase-like protein [Sodiomyces alkalinus F11]ROT41239.1 kinase-like protein [Sodiomyces alkalinus F11]
MSTTVSTTSRFLSALQAQGRLIFEGPHTVRKVGEAFLIRREAEAMDYVKKNTSIPIPTVLRVHLDDASNGKSSWILMQRLSGLELGTAWPQMDDDARSETICQLRSYLEQLHRLRPATAVVGRIGSASGGPAWDHRLSNMSTCGPFESVAEFHDFLVAPVRQCPRPELVAKYRSQLADTYDVCFAHADLSWENILVDVSTGQIQGILDWEMAGFWPEWWEYRKALFGSRSQQWWRHILKEVMVERTRETEIDMELEMF